MVTWSQKPACPLTWSAGRGDVAWPAGRTAPQKQRLETRWHTLPGTSPLQRRSRYAVSAPPSKPPQFSTRPVFLPPLTLPCVLPHRASCKANYVCRQAGPLPALTLPCFLPQCAHSGPAAKRVRYVARPVFLPPLTLPCFLPQPARSAGERIRYVARPVLLPALTLPCIAIEPQGERIIAKPFHVALSRQAVAGDSKSDTKRRGLGNTKPFGRERRPAGTARATKHSRGGSYRARGEQERQACEECGGREQ